MSAQTPSPTRPTGQGGRTKSCEAWRVGRGSRLLATALGASLFVGGALPRQSRGGAVAPEGSKLDTGFTKVDGLGIEGNEAAGGDAFLTVHAPWARATIGASRPGAAYLTIRNDGDEPVVLASLEADVADSATLHRTVTDGAGTSRMEPVDELTIPARERVTFEPGGGHVMLDGLREPLVEGRSVTLTLRLSDGTELDVDVPVLAVTARGPREASR